MRRRDRVAQGPGGGNQFKYQGHWEWAGNQYHFCITLCPQLTTVKDTAKQTTSIWTSLWWDEMSPAHASTKTKKKTKEVPFHIRHRTKLTHIQFQGENECFPGFCFFAITSIDYRDQAHYSWQKIPLLYKIKLLILTFILIQFAE